MLVIHCYKCNRIVKIELASLIFVKEVICPGCREVFPAKALNALQKTSQGYREAVDALVRRGWTKTVIKGWGISLTAEDLRPTRGFQSTHKNFSYWGSKL